MVNAREEQWICKRMERLETLLHEAENFADPQVRARVRELIQAILDLHGMGLERILDLAAGCGEAGPAMVEAIARDDVVGNLLLLHGLHPLDVETRVRQALDKVRPYLRSHGGNVELLAVDKGVVRLRMAGSCQSCPSSEATLKRAIEKAIYESAPDVASIEVEGLAAPALPVAVIPVERLYVLNGQK
jgi:Fe-S cluster biogenesis protein NfuA